MLSFYYRWRERRRSVVRIVSLLSRLLARLEKRSDEMRERVFELEHAAAQARHEQESAQRIHANISALLN